MKISKTIIIVFLGILVLLPVVALAQNFEKVGDTPVSVPLIPGTQTGPAGDETFGELVTSALNVVLLVAGSIALLFLVYGAFRYIESRGNEEGVKKAKDTMQNAIWGLVVILMSFAIINVIARILLTGEIL